MLNKAGLCVMWAFEWKNYPGDFFLIHERRTEVWNEILPEWGDMEKEPRRNIRQRISRHGGHVVKVYVQRVPKGGKTA